MIPIVTTKPGCQFDRIAPGGFKLLAAIQQAAEHTGLSLEITAGTNDHVTGKHVTGEAFDLSVFGLTPSQIILLVGYLHDLLGPLFGVWHEAPYDPPDADLRAITLVNQDATAAHLHCQVKRATAYPPLEGIPI